MILRAGIGMSVVIACMGLVQNVWQLLLLRMLQGVFAGFISNSNALVATETPKTNSGQALGTIASATTAGTLLGPLVGGALTSIFIPHYLYDHWWLALIMLNLSSILRS